ncbi:MAG: fructosamine kinase family protein [Methylococcales bacterium]|nr:fructosamine kinase family protein [Methylococcales bacterium]
MNSGLFMNWNTITEHISAATGQAFTAQSVQTLTGGDINAAFRLQDTHKSYFVKLNRPERVAMFAAEFAGLQALAQTQTLRVPVPVVYGQSNSHTFLVLEHLELGRSHPASDRLLGQQLARLHQQVQPYFGWHSDNTIGSTLQRNTHTADWLNFWREHRLGFQLQLAAKNGYGGRLQNKGERLCSELGVFFTSYMPTPSLLHGDLWAGNAATDRQGQPVVFDPACYYGDREADLAMTELFGGFSQDFYAAYQEIWALNEGYQVRKSLYNLYHILNHLNLFGDNYLRQAENGIIALLSEIGFTRS